VHAAAAVRRFVAVVVFAWHRGGGVLRATCDCATLGFFAAYARAHAARAFVQVSAF
jgi:hypothetical protein